MNDARRPLPFGSWPSPITAARLVEGAAGVSEMRADGDDIWWNEQRPGEGGRYQLVRRGVDGARHDLFPAWDPDGAPNEKWNARTAVLEYGGGAWTVRNGVVVFANWADQRLYRVEPGRAPVAISPAPSVARGWRWSEPTWLDDQWLVCVRESHEPDVVAEHGEAMNELVALPVDGSAVSNPSLVQVLVSGPDFVHSPAVGGDTLAWVQWQHPQMPWDGSELCTARIVRGSDAPSRGLPAGLKGVSTVAGGSTESIVQPGFTHHGDLLFCTDRTGWWNPWRLPAGGEDVEPVLAGGGVEGEIGGGLWVGGLRWWAELGDGRLLVTLTRDGADALAVVAADGHLTELATPFTEVTQVVASGDGRAALVVAGSPVSESTPYRVTLGGGADPVEIEALRPGRDLGFDAEWFSAPQHVSFPSARGRTAHALVYPPTNPEAVGPAGERAPLVVMIHGGPTSAARNRLDLAKQFWTSRGFAVADVNYGGSTGYGRPYRELLNGAWGVVDVEDAVAVAGHLAAEGLVDVDRLAIRGGSAGGFTTLAALCFHQTFRAGASHYGVADLTALATDTHKFESRYLDTMVGPWPAARERYEARSPINHTDGFNAPLIVLQGSEDEVVPPNQAEMIVNALRDKGVPHAYLLFEGEQHGFRQAANIVRALEAELWFYGRVFGFTPNDSIVAVEGAFGL
ncbi:MAG: prolyl oligopeptidase family serine peptidase [Aquihabitans sp.]